MLMDSELSGLSVRFNSVRLVANSRPGQIADIAIARIKSRQPRHISLSDGRETRLVQRISNNRSEVSIRDSDHWRDNHRRDIRRHIPQQSRAIL